MAVTGTASLSVTNVGGGSGALACEVDWTADGSGNVTSAPLTFPPGSILTVEFTPGVAPHQPTNLYSVTFTDAGGVSMFDDGGGGNIGASLSNVNASHKVPMINGATSTYVRSWLQGGPGYTFGVSGAGAGGAGKVVIFVSSTAV